MKTKKKVPLELIEVEFIPHHNEMEFGKFYYSKKLKCANHLCPCGCRFPTPIRITTGEWDLKIIDNKLNVSPSILQRFGCKTHYIITDGMANIV